MKKFLAIPLFLVYFLAITGVTIQQACCQTDSSFAAMASSETPDHDCCHQTPYKKEARTIHQNQHCCNGHVVIVKIIQSQLSEKVQQLNLLQTATVLPTDKTAFSAALAVAEGAHTYTAPPGIWQDIPLYKLHKRFTYYG